MKVGMVGGDRKWEEGIFFFFILWLNLFELENVSDILIIIWILFVWFLLFILNFKLLKRYIFFYRFNLLKKLFIFLFMCFYNVGRNLFNL